jgi:hypothetical protein
VPSTLVRTVGDVNIMTRMEDRLFKMDERGKIVNVKWMFLLLDLMSTVQREVYGEDEEKPGGGAKQ